MLNSDKVTQLLFDMGDDLDVILDDCCSIKLSDRVDFKYVYNLSGV